MRFASDIRTSDIDHRLETDGSVAPVCTATLTALRCQKHMTKNMATNKKGKWMLISTAKMAHELLIVEGRKKKGGTNLDVSARIATFGKWGRWWRWQTFTEKCTGPPSSLVKIATDSKIDEGANGHNCHTNDHDAYQPRRWCGISGGNHVHVLQRTHSIHFNRVNKIKKN